MVIFGDTAITYLVHGADEQGGDRAGRGLHHGFDHVAIRVVAEVGAGEDWDGGVGGGGGSRKQVERWPEI